MRKEEYIREVISRIENKKAQKEVERELSAHIDDRISYYTDAGYDEQTANEKAMEHMGEAKKLSEKLGSVHNGRRRKCFIALLCVLGAYAVLSFFTTDLLTVGIEYEYLPERILLISNVAVLLLLLFFVIYAYFKKGSLLLCALAMEQFLVIATLIGGVDYPIYITYTDDRTVLATVALSLLVAAFVLTVFGCSRTDRGELSKKKRARKAVFSVITVTLLSFAMFCVFATQIIFFGTFYELKSEDIAEKYFADYIAAEMPTEQAKTSEIDCADADELEEKYQIGIGSGMFSSTNFSGEKWRIIGEKVKPVKKLPDKFNTKTEAYWLTNYDSIIIKKQTSSGFFTEMSPNFSYKINDETYPAVFFIEKSYLFSEDFKYPDFENDRVSQMLVCDIDFSPAFTDFESEVIRKMINIQDYGQVNKLGKDIRYNQIKWRFESSDIVENELGFLLEKDGKFYIINEIHKDYDGSGAYTTYAPLYELDEKINEKIREIIENNKNKYYSSAFPSD